MRRTAHALSFLSTATVALFAAAFAFLAVFTWTGMYLPTGQSAAVAGAAVFLPSYLFNWMLTASYRRLDGEASQWGSIFGILLMAQIAVVPVLALGIAGTPAKIATQEAYADATVFLGLTQAPDEATLDSFPLSDVDTGVIWVPNVGTTNRPRIIARQADGSLEAVTLPPRGEVLTAHSEAFVGPVNTDTDKVMLCPIPSDGDLSQRVVENHWDGGVAKFTIRRGERSATFIDN